MFPFLSLAAAAAEPDPAHDELRAVRDTLLAAIGARDVDAVVATLHPNVVFTTTNGEAVRGREGVKTWVSGMLDGPDAVVKAFSYEVTSDELSVLYGGDTAIAWGPSVDHYTLTNGETWNLNTRWSATLVREDGRWLVASVHSSVDPFHNPILDAAVGWLPRAALGGAVGGLVLGALGGFFVGRRRR